MGKCLRQLESEGIGYHEPIPSTDAADTSSFTLSRQRENIAGVELGTLGAGAAFWPDPAARGKLKIEN